ncbi:hypothetical protein FIBSPDRAFT_949555 [Athelia psychrophila]|uniref:Uncharacterized protein n=1 Tax=Athelia psychrophila TaxID=1759441 RepID=A0A166PRT2_9AGAM|nr:hypothetical protein FIBSPDRAFT_949555 [Fibularhizoctonia sp. CBS 109695]
MVSDLSPLSSDAEAPREATDHAEIVLAGSAGQVQSVAGATVAQTTAPLDGLSAGTVPHDIDADGSASLGIVASSSDLRVRDAPERGVSPVSSVFSEGALRGPLTPSHGTRARGSVSYSSPVVTQLGYSPKVFGDNENRDSLG